MERELLLTGIGGQGIQLAARVLAEAATREGRHVMYLGTYAGTMRGASSDSCVVFGDAPIVQPPIVAKAWSTIAMHHQFWEPAREKLRDGGVLLVDSTLFRGELGDKQVRRFEVPATALATELGNAGCASMVMIAAYCKLTGIFALDSLIAAMIDSIRSYRSHLIAANARALEAGYAAIPAPALSFWLKDAA
jgi:Pyruvate/2-oxoacid:ferredoxin oxidoreductase gamma subunit